MLPGTRSGDAYRLSGWAAGSAWCVVGGAWGGGAFRGGACGAAGGVGYDVTWSAPKSVSALWAQGSPELRTAIDWAIKSSVDAGMSYLESAAFHVRVGRGREKGSNMLAAGYRHDTNRNLEPQLHEHVVVANLATKPNGETQAVDARGLVRPFGVCRVSGRGAVAV